MEIFTSAINNGIMSPNEARHLEDLDGYEGGDKRFINAANIPADQMEEWIDAKINNLNNKNKNNNPTGENNGEQ
jgi:hypothetical protein